MMLSSVVLPLDAFKWSGRMVVTHMASGEQMTGKLSWLGKVKIIQLQSSMRAPVDLRTGLQKKTTKGQTGEAYSDGLQPGCPIWN